MSDPPIDGSTKNSTPPASTPPPAAQPVNPTKKQKGYDQTWATLFIELSFVAFPFVVIFIVLVLHDKTSRILEISEFSFAGIILGGQGITKYVSGALAKKKAGDASRPHITMLIAVVSALLLVFATIILYRIVEVRETIEPAGQLSRGLIICQIVILLIGTLMFIILGGSGELARIRSEKAEI
jgi:hypothetical protein